MDPLDQNQNIPARGEPGAPPSDVIDRASDSPPEPAPTPVMVPAIPTPDQLREGYIDGRFKVHHDEAIVELSTEFAKACRVSGRKNVEDITMGEIYGLIFHPKFPPPVTLIRRLRQMENNFLPRIIDEGKIELAGVARYMVILEKPTGMRLSEYITTRGPLMEPLVSDAVVPGLNEALGLLHEEGYIHGSLNATTVFYDEATRQVRLSEFFSNYTGHAQHPSYETTARLLSHPLAKGNTDSTADYYALGVLLVHVLTGKEPLGDFTRQEVLSHRVANGSYDVTVFELFQQRVKLTGRFQQLLRSLLKDNDNDRWDSQDVAEWLAKKVTAVAHSAKAARETTNPFVFLAEKYYSRRHLAQAIFAEWNKAKTNLKPAELVRWLRLSLKQSPLAEKMENLFSAHMVANANLLIPDERLARMLILLDPEGPVRYKSFAVHPQGVGAFLSYGYYRGDRDMIQFVGDLLNDRLVEFWTEVNEENMNGNYVALTWSPYKEYQYARKGAFGFGIERCLYDLNPTLACQSPLVVDDQVLDLQGLMNVLNEKAATKRPDTDPVDRHIAAFIANRIDLLDEIRVKSLQRFPILNKNAQVNMLALLTVAQSHGGIKALKGLTGWMSVRLSNFIDEFHSDSIKREIRSTLDKSAREGNLNAMFRAISDAAVPTRDNNGYADAKAQYQMLEQEIRMLESGGVVERLGYQYGLKFAMMLSYVVLGATTLLALARLT